MMDEFRGKALLRTCLLLLICLQAGSVASSTGPKLDPLLEGQHGIQRRLLQAPAPGSATPAKSPAPTPADTPASTTPAPVATTAAPKTPPTSAPVTIPPATPAATTVAPTPLATTAEPTPTPTTLPDTPPPTTPALVLTTSPPITLAPTTLPPATLAPTSTPVATPSATPLGTTAVPLAPPTLTPAVTTPAPVQSPVPPPGKKPPPPPPLVTLAGTPPRLSPTIAPTPLATSTPQGNASVLLTVNASAPTPPLLTSASPLAAPLASPDGVNTSEASAGTSLAPATPNASLLFASPPPVLVNGSSQGRLAPAPLPVTFTAPPLLMPPPVAPSTLPAPPPPTPSLPAVNLSSVVVSTPEGAPACLPGTANCDPLVVKMLVSNTDYLSLSEDLLPELADQLGLQTNQLAFSALQSAGSITGGYNVTFYVLPVSGFNISNVVASNVSDALSTHKVQLDETRFGNYTYFYAVPESALEAGPVASVAPAPAPIPAPAPAPAPSVVTPPVVTGGGSKGGSSSTVIIVAAAVGGVAFLAICACVMFCCLCRRKKGEEPDTFSEYSKSSLNPASMNLNSRIQPHSFRTMSSAASMPSDSLPRPSSARVFTYEELEEATNRWDPMYLLGEGGFGKVYKGVLKDGVKVAVKKLTVGGHQGDREFQVEVEMLSRLHHRHLVKLIGYYYRPEQQLLCYELVMNGSLENHLHGHGRQRRPPGAMWQTLQLDWDARMKIAIGAARGLAYLHEDCQPTVIHRDMKASNILLEDNFHAKVADFGLAKIAPDNRSDYLTTRVMGTFGYVAPEYAMTGHIMVKSDVYSYGVVLLELLTGRKPVDMSQPQGEENLVTWARPLLMDPERVEHLVDPRLGEAYPYEDLLKVSTIASHCVNPDPARRPHMGEVVQKLRALQRTAAGAESHQSDDSASRDMEALASSLSGPLPAYTQSQPYPGTYMSTAYPPFPGYRSMELPMQPSFQSDNLSRLSSETGSQSLMLDHDQLARTTVFSEGLEEGR